MENHKENEGSIDLQSNQNFESVIENPLACSEGSNHEYSKRKTTSEKT